MLYWCWAYKHISMNEVIKKTVIYVPSKWVQSKTCAWAVCRIWLVTITRTQCQWSTDTLPAQLYNIASTRVASILDRFKHQSIVSSVQKKYRELTNWLDRIIGKIKSISYSPHSNIMQTGRPSMYYSFFC